MNSLFLYLSIFFFILGFVLEWAMLAYSENIENNLCEIFAYSGIASFILSFISIVIYLGS